MNNCININLESFSKKLYLKYLYYLLDLFLHIIIIYINYIKR